jgi:hypothetical protein
MKAESQWTREKLKGKVNRHQRGPWPVGTSRMGSKKQIFVNEHEMQANSFAAGFLRRGVSSV